MRIAHADVMHVIERVADVVDARPADADALGDEPRASMQVQLAHVGGMSGVGDERQGAHGFAPDPDRDQPRLIHPSRHLAIPEPCECASQSSRVDAICHSPTRPAAAQAHHEARLLFRSPVARGKDAERAVITVRAPERFLAVIEAGRPHERAIAKHPKVAFGQLCAELSQVHRCARIIESTRCLHAARR